MRDSESVSVRMNSDEVFECVYSQSRSGGVGGGEDSSEYVSMNEGKGIHHEDTPGSECMREKMGIHRFIVSIFIDIQYAFQTIFLRIKAGYETNIHDIM